MKKVFLIDDDVDDREIFRIALKTIQLECRLIEAVDGQDALNLIADENFDVPDIIFLDLNMPRVGGLDVLKNVRAIQLYNQIPIIMYTTSSVQQDKDNCLKAGATGFITKHYDFDALCVALKSQFGII